MKLLSAPIHKYCKVFEVEYPSPTRLVGLESSPAKGRSASDGKSEVRNLKQIQKSNAQNTKLLRIGQREMDTKVLNFRFWSFGFVLNFGFRYSDLIQCNP
jgi:hypothetical protein